MSGAPVRAQDRDTIEAGHQLYDTHCASCHGERLQNPGSSFDLRALHPNERARFETSLLDGKGTQMPPWRGMFGEAEIDQLLGLCARERLRLTGGPRNLLARRPLRCRR